MVQPGNRLQSTCGSIVIGPEHIWGGLERSRGPNGLDLAKLERLWVTMEGPTVPTCNYIYRADIQVFVFVSSVRLGNYNSVLDPCLGTPVSVKSDEVDRRNTGCDDRLPIILILDRIVG